MIDNNELLNKCLYLDIVNLKRAIKEFLKYNNDESVLELYDACSKRIKELDDATIYDVGITEENIVFIELTYATLSKLDYNELKYFKYIYYIVTLNNNDEIFKNIYLIVSRLIAIKEDIIRKNIYQYDEMNKEEFDILLNISSTANLEWFAIDCNVEVSELTSEILYDRYHKENVLRRG